MSDKPLIDHSIEELEAMLNDPDSIGKTEPEPVIEAVVETPAAPAVPEPEVVAGEAPAEPVIDLAALEAEERKIDRDRLETKLEQLTLHNSRLAGQIGELRKTQSRAGTEYAEIPQDDERIVELRRTVQELKDAQRSEARGRAVSEEIQAVLAKPYLKGVDQAFVAAATQKYDAAWNEAISEEDPDLARLNARTVLLSVAAEARRNQLDKATTAARERSVEQTRVATSAKLKASVSGGGSAAVAAPRVALKDKSLAEMAAMLDELTR